MVLKNADDEKESFYFEFNKNNSFGMEIIERLVNLRPLFGKGENAVYNIYRDQYRKQCINYMMLSNSLTNLGLE